MDEDWRALRITDGDLTLSPLRPEDGAIHLAGEDEAFQRWYSGGVSTAESVAEYLQTVTSRWRAGGPIYHFGIRVGPKAELAGTLDVQLEMDFTRPGQANLAYGLYPQWRGRGIATRALTLAMRFLVEHTDAREAMVQTEPENTASAAVALRAGFTLVLRADADNTCDRYERVLPFS